MKKTLAILASASLLISAPAQASWLSKITGVHVNLNGGGGPFVRIEPPQPQAIPEMLRNLPKDVAQFALSPDGTALAAAIRHARSRARPGSNPLPPNIRQQLAPFFPAKILDKARWKMRSNLGFALDNAVLGVGDQDAITLDDVIVFNNNVTPNIELWAHELTHVMQYDNMGVESFAFVYSRAFWEIEHDARRNAAEVNRRVAQGSAGPAHYAVSAYSSASAIGSQQLQMSQFRQAAKQFVPAADCVRWQTNGPGAVVQNICVVPIGLTAWRQVNPWNGMAFDTPCAANCGIGPGMVKQFVSPQAGMWVNIGFTY